MDTFFNLVTSKVKSVSFEGQQTKIISFKMMWKCFGFHSLFSIRCGKCLPQSSWISFLVFYQMWQMFTVITLDITSCTLSNVRAVYFSHIGCHSLHSIRCDTCILQSHWISLLVLHQMWQLLSIVNQITICTQMWQMLNAVTLHITPCTPSGVTAVYCSLRVAWCCCVINNKQKITFSTLNIRKWCHTDNDKRFSPL